MYYANIQYWYSLYNTHVFKDIDTCDNKQILSMSQWTVFYIVWFKFEFICYCYYQAETHVNHDKFEHSCTCSAFLWNSWLEDICTLVYYNWSIPCLELLMSKWLTHIFAYDSFSSSKVTFYIRMTKITSSFHFASCDILNPGEWSVNGNYEFYLTTYYNQTTGIVYID